MKEGPTTGGRSKNRLAKTLAVFFLIFLSFAGGILFGKFVSFFGQPPSPPSGLLTNGLKNPLYVTSSVPVFSAVYNDPSGAKDKATNYQIQMSVSGSFSSIYWDSGKTPLVSSTPVGSRIPDISYSGPRLAPSTTYYWRIKLWDAGDAEGPWSTDVSTFLTSAWQATTPLPTALYAAASAAYNGYIYILGGDTGGNTQRNEVYVSRVNADGTLGSWSKVNSFSTERMLPSSFAANGFLYIIGGGNATTDVLSDVQFAPINSDGTLGTWSQTTPLPRASWGQTMAVVGDHVYILGGGGVYGGLTDTLVSQIQPNGQLGPWVNTTPMPHQAWRQTAFGYNGYLYLLGGGGFQDTYYAPINPDGTIGDWVVSRPLEFPTTNHNQASALFGDTLYLYLSDCKNISPDLHLFQSTHLSSVAGLGSWATEPQQATVCSIYPAHTQLNGRFYLLGGERAEGGTTATDEVWVYTP